MQTTLQLADMELDFPFECLKIRVCKFTKETFECSFPRHHHGKYYYELHLVYSGRGTLRTDNETYPLYAGCIYMTGPNFYHEQQTDVSDCMKEYCFGFSAMKQKKKSDSCESHALQDTAFWISTDSGCFLRSFGRIAEECENHRFGFAEVIRNELEVVLIQLVRCYFGNQQPAEHMITVSADRRVNLIDEMFLQHCTDITEEQLSRLLHISVRQLQRFLVNQYGKTFSQMKKEARLDRAQALLRKGCTLSEAADSTGYTDIRYFAQLLKHFQKKSIHEKRQ